MQNRPPRSVYMQISCNVHGRVWVCAAVVCRLAPTTMKRWGVQGGPPSACYGKYRPLLWGTGDRHKLSFRFLFLMCPSQRMGNRDYRGARARLFRTFFPWYRYRFQDGKIIADICQYAYVLYVHHIEPIHVAAYDIKHTTRGDLKATDILHTALHLQVTL